MAVDSPLVVVTEVLPLEGHMDTPVLGDSPLELRVDHMVVSPQGAPTSVDADHSGYISLKELKQALVNSNWSSFNDETCLMMINMFDKTKSGRIDVVGFSALWRFLQQWKSLFQQYDRDRSGSISSVELQQALSQMGYNLSPQFTQLLVSRYCARSATPAMQLDCFIKVCTQLQVLTEAFREKDTAVQGNIRLSFEDVVTMTASRML
ncbi:hypothetical protein ACRRTK_011655 [Alexandromys fortis]